MSNIVFLMNLINAGTDLDTAMTLTSVAYKLTREDKSALLTVYDNQDYDSANLV